MKKKILARLKKTFDASFVILLVALLVCALLLFLGWKVFVADRLSEHNEERAATSETDQAMDSEPDNYTGFFSGYYTGQDEDKKKVKRWIEMYFAECSEDGHIEGVASIDYGENGYFSFEGEVDFREGDLTLTQTAWLSETPLTKKNDFTLHYSGHTFTGRLNNDEKKKIGLEEYASVTTGATLQADFEDRERLAATYDKEDSGESY